MSNSPDDKIEALRARFRASEANLEDRKVVVFGKLEEGQTAEVYVAPDKPAPEPGVAEAPVKRIERDFDAIETLTACLKEAEQGHVRGVIVLMGRATTDDRELVTDVVTQISFTAADNPQIFAGGLRTSEFDLFGMAGDLMGEIPDED